MDVSRVVVLVAFLGGAVGGGVAVGAVTPAAPVEIDPENPPTGVETATGCIDEAAGPSVWPLRGTESRSST